jgi:hypothetical protein
VAGGGDSVELVAGDRGVDGEGRPVDEIEGGEVIDGGRGFPV